MTISGLYLLISSGCGNIDNPSFPAPNIENSTPAVAPLPNFENIKVAVDEEGLPVEYVLPHGKKVSFDREEVKKIREKAISSKEPEIIKIIPIPSSVNIEGAYNPFD